MRKRKKHYLLELLLLCCVVLQSCLLENHKDQKPGQLCVTLADGSVECRPVDGRRVLLLRGGADAPQVLNWDASTSLDTARLSKIAPAQALLEVLREGDAAALQYSLDPGRTAIRIQGNTVFLTDRQSGQLVQKFVLDANRAIAFAPAADLASTFDYLVYAEEVCKPMSLLDSLLRLTEGKYEAHLTHCGNSLYARMGHVIVAISEFRPVETKPLNCDTLHIQKGWTPAHDVASTLTALGTPPAGSAEGPDEPGHDGVFLLGLPFEGLSIYLCGDRIKLVPSDPDQFPYYIDPTRCCYVLRRNAALGLLEIWFSDDQSA